MVDWEFKEKYGLEDFIRIIDVLRGPGGCPWDIKQTHESLKHNVVEEAWEVVDAIDEGSADHLREELGDLLMQVIFHASIEKEQRRLHARRHLRRGREEARTPPPPRLRHREGRHARRGAHELGRHKARRPRPAERRLRHGRHTPRPARAHALARRYSPRPPSTASTGRTSPARWTSSARRSASSRRV